MARRDCLLDDAAIIQPVSAAVARRSRLTTRRGRPSTPVAVACRMLVVQRLHRWRDAETEHVVSDRLVLRQVCRVDRQCVPDDTTWLRWTTGARAGIEIA